MIRRIHITGVVQGVGFRPFVYNLASRLNLTGFCMNDSDGVVIEVEGDSIDSFLSELKDCAPPLSRIEGLTVEELPGSIGAKGFSIRESDDAAGSFTLVSPDIATCDDCLGELLDPADRRHLYPFINCTSCGPRYSIVTGIPYDRPKTTMAGFRMCPECEAEYNDPRDRRFHAQPNACPRCGPGVWLSEGGTTEPSSDETDFGAIQRAQTLLREGAVVAVKGIGGFHLACDATNEEAVRRLRAGKRGSVRSRLAFSDKPFALMSPDLETIGAYAEASGPEREALLDRARPIVLLKKRLSGPIASAVAPMNKHYGVMLPYTPVHHLLFHTGGFTALVMTSGNLADEPIVTSNSEAVKRLSGIADFFLLHDRGIHMRVDDSILRVDSGKRRLLRRARGFTPGVIPLGEEGPDVLAFGPYLKNTFCITRGAYAIPGPHIGDLDDIGTEEFFCETLGNLKSTFRAEPVAVAHDLHPGYPSTRLALEYAKRHAIPDERVYAVQHHHAHVAGCMAEHGLHGSVIGVAFDGAGLGTDNTIWGGEFLVADRSGFERAAHLSHMPMPGGDMAALEPWRMALGCIWRAYGDAASEVIERFFARVDEKKRTLVGKMLRSRVNTPLTSSAGRLFDAVSSILGLKDANGYEGEAAMALEYTAAAAAERIEPYPYALVAEHGITRIETGTVIKGVVAEMARGMDRSRISARFHQTMADIIVTVSSGLSERTGIKDVVLTGGVFQNTLLVWMVTEGLRREGLKAWQNEQVPANDGGVALGQAVVARELMKGSTDNKARGERA